MLKIVIISKIDTGFYTLCFETEFNPTRNIDDIHNLIEYCKPIISKNNSEHAYDICEELFNCSQGECKIKNLKLISVDHNDYDNYCIINLYHSSYIFVKLFNFMTNIAVYSTKEWLEFHYPLEQYFEDGDITSEESKLLYRLINDSTKYGTLFGETLNESLEISGILF